MNSTTFSYKLLTFYVQHPDASNYFFNNFLNKHLIFYFELKNFKFTTLVYSEITIMRTSGNLEICIIITLGRYKMQIFNSQLLKSTFN